MKQVYQTLGCHCHIVVDSPTQTKKNPVMAPSKALFLTLVFLGCVPAQAAPSNHAQAAHIVVSAADFEPSLKAALEVAQAGQTIQLPEGRFQLRDQILIVRPGLTLKGAGLKKTVLSFTEQEIGPEGIQITASQTTLEDFAVEDTAGDAIKATAVDHITFRRVRVAWTKGLKPSNGPYGFYPVLSRNVLIEECEVSGSSDAGVYVGQSEQIIVRRNRVFNNVAGIEIENSVFADVFENDVTDNTTGILVFDLPDLPKQGGRHTRVFNNKVYKNNLSNFSTPGNIVYLLAPGLGMLVLANDDVEIFNNSIDDHRLGGIGVAHFAIAERPVQDPRYDQRPEKIYIHDNKFNSAGWSFFSGRRLDTIVKLLSGFKPVDILYDGISDGTYEGTKPSADERVCLKNNSRTDGSKATFANLHLDNSRKWLPFPGGPATTEQAEYECEHPNLAAITLEKPEALPDLSQSIKAKAVATAKACSNRSQKAGAINWAAAEYDCPALSDYNLFQNPADPTRQPLGRGQAYALRVPLFTDHADKHRFVFLPDGTKAEFKEEGVFDFPVGTIISKTFSFPNANGGRELIETRLLIHRKQGWSAVPYIWDREQKMAHLDRKGEVRDIQIAAGPFKGEKVHYQIPGQDRCVMCHGNTNGFTPIGLKARFLNFDWSETGESSQAKNQIAQWSASALFANPPKDLMKIPRIAFEGKTPEAIESRAKAYLDMNCSHCHSPQGKASNTALYLEYGRPFQNQNFGYCKPPVAAGPGTGGNHYAIQPASAEKSILAFRLRSTHLAVRMPALGRSVPDQQGITWVEEWINQLPAQDCKKL
jgi:parallel beta-helix repeat protein